MIHINRKPYPYMEEINLAVVNLFPETTKHEKVLDVGCGRAALTAVLKEKGYLTCGIENNQDACDVASSRLDELIQEDLTAYTKIAENLVGKTFDYIIFADVLEHTYDPRTILEFYSKFLNIGGQIVISVPNGAVWLNRLNYLAGRIEYTNTGTMDRTHIRFFTFRTTIRLLKSIGFVPAVQSFTPFISRSVLPLLKRTSKIHTDIITSKKYRVYKKYILPVEMFITSLCPQLLGFQIVIKAKKI